MDKTKEIRQILLGRLAWAEDGRLVAAGGGQRIRFQGLANGWGAVHFLGITRKVRGYQLPYKPTQEMVTGILSRMGRGVYLQETPKASACLCRYFMAAPVLLTVECSGKWMQVSAFTARGLLSPLTCRRALRTFRKELPEEGPQTPAAPSAAKLKEKTPSRPKHEKQEKKGGKRLRK